MQAPPIRLSQTIWSAFKAAKPVNRVVSRPLYTTQARQQRQFQGCTADKYWASHHVRFYSENKSEVDRKIENAKSKIDDALDARAEVAGQDQTRLKDPQDETIVHTIPESSSIVYNSTRDGDIPTQNSSASSTSREAYPTESSSTPSSFREQFSNFMDNFQSKVFIASKRLNDLTGYSSIEKLKKDIENQELYVQNSRRAVKEARTNYSEAIATRSTTQREVNDLLQRKHAWSPTDLERFTTLYRSDHANEQTEAAAQRAVGDAEAQYEEASTRLARTILARYHEEQIWSDKIRQMSTWGTWGLMGLNLLLFVILQIAIEPWRRRRLVKGFEDKVEIALREQKEATLTPAILGPNTTAAISPPEEPAEDVANAIAEQIVDAVTGSTDPSPPPTPSTTMIEEAVEEVTEQELAADQAPSDLVTTLAGYRVYCEESIRELLRTDKVVALNHRELTTFALEAAATGAAVMGIIAAVVLRAR